MAVLLTLLLIKQTREYNPVVFTDATEVRASGVIGHVFTKAGDELIPTFNPPAYENGQLVWQFIKPTSGLII